jgi:cytochrome c-type biogenesis protein CcmH
VLLKQPLNARTALLWGLPAGVLVVGAIVLILAIRRRRQGSESAPQGIPLSAAEQARIDRLLDADPRTRT